MSDWLYLLLLRLYPRAFRERYAEEMVRVFRDRLRDERAARVWIDVLRDAVVSIPRQHIVREPHAFYPPSAAPLRAAYAVVVQALIASAILGAVVGLVGTWAWYAGVAELRAVVARLPGSWLLAGLLAALLFVTWLITARRAYRTSQTLKALRAEASGDSVTVGHEGLAPLTLRRSDVIGLHEFEKVGLRIETADRARDLWVPARAESYAGVKARISEWAPLKATPLLRVPVLTLPLLAVLYPLALFIPMTFAGFVAGPLLAFVPLSLAKRDLSAPKKLLPLVPLAILLVRWLW